MSPFYSEGNLAGTPVLFSLSVRRQRCSQVGGDVLRQDAVVLRFLPGVIRTKRAQKPTPFPGMAFDVLAPPQVGDGLANSSISQLTIIANKQGSRLAILANGPTIMANSLQTTRRTHRHCK
jgi:hypothetical protein